MAKFPDFLKKKSPPDSGMPDMGGGPPPAAEPTPAPMGGLSVTVNVNDYPDLKGAAEGDTFEISGRARITSIAGGSATLEIDGAAFDPSGARDTEEGFTEGMDEQA